MAASHSLGRVIIALIAEEARIQAVVVVDLHVKPAREGVLLHPRRALELGDVEVGIGRGALQDDGLGRLEGIKQGQDGRHGAGTGESRGHGLHEVDVVVEPVALVAQVEEGFVLHQRASERHAELVQTERRLGLLAVDDGIEGVGGIERVIAEILEGRAMEIIGAGLGDDGDLAARSRAVLGRIVVGIHSEFLNVLQARLETEGRGNLTIEFAGGGVNDGRTVDAIITDDVLLDGAAGESDVAEGAGTRVHGAGGLQVELGELPSVDRQLSDFALVDVGAVPGRRHIDGGGFGGDLDGLAETRGLERKTQVDLLSDEIVSSLHDRIVTVRVMRRKLAVTETSHAWVMLGL